jgi:hypothetical protein
MLRPRGDRGAAPTPVDVLVDFALPRSTKMFVRQEMLVRPTIAGEVMRAGKATPMSFLAKAADQGPTAQSP